MSRNQGLRRALVLAAVSGGLALAGCGKQGVLEQPPPLFGARAKAAYEAQKAQEARDDAQRAAARPSGDSNDQSAGDNAPRTRRDVKDPAQILTPARVAPVPGAPDPSGPPVQAAPSF
jgi:predicted small lipoprotein YifL